MARLKRVFYSGGVRLSQHIIRRNKTIIMKASMDNERPKDVLPNEDLDVTFQQSESLMKKSHSSVGKAGSAVAGYSPKGVSNNTAARRAKIQRMFSLSSVNES